jgi:hypothetical protein
VCGLRVMGGYYIITRMGRCRFFDRACSSVEVYGERLCGSEGMSIVVPTPHVVNVSSEQMFMENDVMPGEAVSDLNLDYQNPEGK